MNTTPSGLQYQDTLVGGGKQASAGHDVTVHYTGWLWVDGAKAAKFDSSLHRGEPFEFELGAGMVIRGWDEGVQGMQVGGKRTLIIPAELGYGARGAGGVIPPHAVLCFEVELLGLAGGPEVIDLALTRSASGLQFEDRIVGEGAEATKGQRVSVHYTGWLYQDGMRGKKFDSSKDRGQPFKFRLGVGQTANRSTSNSSVACGGLTDAERRRRGPDKRLSFRNAVMSSFAAPRSSHVH